MQEWLTTSPPNLARESSRQSFDAIRTLIRIGYLSCWMLFHLCVVDRRMSYALGCQARERWSDVKTGRKQEIYRSEEHTSELQSLMRISYDVFCLKKNKNTNT